MSGCCVATAGRHSHSDSSKLSGDEGLLEFWHACPYCFPFHCARSLVLQYLDCSLAAWLRTNGVLHRGDRWRLAILFIPTALFRSVLPMLSNLHAENPEGYRRVHGAQLQINLIVVIVPVLIIACLSVPIMSSYGSGFSAGWSVLAVLCVATIPRRSIRSLAIR